METQAAPKHVGIEIQTWFEKRKKQLLYGAVALFVVIVGISAFLQYQSNKEVAASEALSEIRIPFNPTTPAQPDTAQKLFDVANRHKGTKAAARALHLSGGFLFVEKDYSHAQERFNALIQTYPESPWVPDANLGIAACLEAQGKTDDAVKKYEDIRKRYASATIVDDAKLALARLYEKSNPTESWKLYEDLLNAERGSGMSAEAGLRQEELVKQHPELANLRPPPPAPPQPANQPQITMMTNRPNTNRVMTITNVVRSTNAAGNVVTSSSPVQIRIAPPTAPANTPSATAPATTPPTPPPASPPATGTAPAPTPAPTPAK